MERMGHRKAASFYTPRGEVIRHAFDCVVFARNDSVAGTVERRDVDALGQIGDPVTRSGCVAVNGQHRPRFTSFAHQTAARGDEVDRVLDAENTRETGGRELT